MTKNVGKLRMGPTRNSDVAQAVHYRRNLPLCALDHLFEGEESFCIVQSAADNNSKCKNTLFIWQYVQHYTVSVKKQ